MGHKWEQNGPILDLAQEAHAQPTFVEKISDLILHIVILTEYFNSFLPTLTT